MKTTLLASSLLLALAAAPAMAQERSNQNHNNAAHQNMTHDNAAHRNADHNRANNTTERPDAWVHTKVGAKFMGSSTVAFRDIDTEVNNGVVSLTGTVGTEAEKQEAIRLARDTEGVRSVNANNLRVGPAGSSRNDGNMNRTERMDRTDAPRDRTNNTAERPDAWVHTKVAAKFVGSSTVTFRDIDTEVNNGVVSLTGMVATESEKQEAIRLARETEGVRSVNANNLRVGTAANNARTP